MSRHWSEDSVEDIKGAAIVFITAVVLIYVVLYVAKVLYPTFPLDNTSSTVVAVIVSIFFSFLRYTKNRASPQST